MVSTQNSTQLTRDRFKILSRLVQSQLTPPEQKGVPYVPCAMSSVDDCTLSVQFLNGSSFTLTLPCSTLGRDVQQTISERLGGKAAAGVSLAYHDVRLRFLDKNGPYHETSHPEKLHENN